MSEQEKAQATPPANEAKEKKNSQCEGGALLASARKEQGLSQAAVSKSLNLSKQKIQMIETNQFPDNQLDVYYRGYIRAYAMLLKLNPEDVFAKLIDCNIDLGHTPLKVDAHHENEKMPALNRLIKKQGQQKPLFLLMGFIALFIALFTFSKVKHHPAQSTASNTQHNMMMQESKTWQAPAAQTASTSANAHNPADASNTIHGEQAQQNPPVITIKQNEG